MKRANLPGSTEWGDPPASGFARNSGSGYEAIGPRRSDPRQRRVDGQSAAKDRRQPNLTNYTQITTPSVLISSAQLDWVLNRMEDRRPSATPLAREGPTADLGTTTTTPAPVNPSTFDLDTFITYLNQLVPVLLGQDKIDSLFEDDEFNPVATRFASDPSQAVVYVVKQRDEHDLAEGEHSPPQNNAGTSH